MTLGPYATSGRGARRHIEQEIPFLSLGSNYPDTVFGRWASGNSSRLLLEKSSVHILWGRVVHANCTLLLSEPIPASGSQDELASPYPNLLV